jgi:enamine deaminase RidA (YjgF/YER057c/UK114 family)
MRIASMLVTINATAEFADHTAVADAASDLLIDVFGPPGRHARLAVGVASLPGNVALELTAVVEAPVETV